MDNLAAEILAIDAFTVDVQLPNGGPTVKGIFDSEPSTASLGIGIDAPAPQITLATAVAKNLFEGDLLRIKGREYLCKNVAPDDEGLTAVPLKLNT